MPKKCPSAFSTHAFSAFFKQKARKQFKNTVFELLFYYAERAGFEPAIPVSQYDGLANRWFQPLTHLSKAEILN